MSPRPATADPDVAAIAVELRLVLSRLVRRLRGADLDGLTPTQLSMLANLDEHGPLRLGELANREGISAPTASKVVDTLVTAGMIERSTDPEDRRGTRLSLTSAGRRLLATIGKRRNAILADRLGLLPDADREAVVAALPVLRRLLETL